MIWRSPRSRPASMFLSRSRWRRRPNRCAVSSTRRTTKADSDGGPHLPLYSGRPENPRTHRRRTTRRDLLLQQHSREPRPVSKRRERNLGSGGPRHIDHPHILNEKPVAVSATGASHVAGTPENMAHITLFFQSSCVAHISVNWLSPVKVRQTFIGGSRKMIVYDDLQPTEKIKVYDKGITVNGIPEKAHQLRIGYRAGDMWAPHLSARRRCRRRPSISSHALAVVRSPISDGITGLRVVEILEAASRSIAEQGKPVRIEQRKPVRIKGKDRVVEEVF